MAQSEAAVAFRESVLAAMEKKGVSQRQLAKSLGMSHVALNQVLTGKQNVTLPRAERIAKALEIELGEIFSTTRL